MIIELRTTDEQAGRRLDEVLALLAAISKGEARRIIDRGGCVLNGAMVRVASRSVRSGDLLTVGVMEPGRFQELELSPEAIIYQDKHLLAVNKPPGVASQRTPYQLKGTLEYWVAEEFARQGVREPVRIVHRLDRGTSGLMLFPKHRQEAAWLSELFRRGEMGKRYLALIAGAPPAECWQAEGPIGKVASARWGIVPGGRPARTEFRLLATEEGTALVEALPHTGRTHQIRVHLAADGLPIVGDATYGGTPCNRLMLHCAELSWRRRDGTLLRLAAPPDEAYRERCGRCWSAAAGS
ncbi:RluA family pseudouridine synthase [Trichlorobacter ammonificans]|uniref:Pseudouridine synthase, RluA family n=1 Tax=Trichlorobacter ammonificans TaxID=2916410 RepID=A0ABM9DCA0_9BACT|nr:RluA family pseudouridine synthase [Trichlorobacter ammonificans]CAH2032474.1 Pseudouridine synthase, RluA family [Trichlorobacter ammonificans]